jgi:hypothetical protein
MAIAKRLLSASICLPTTPCNLGSQIPAQLLPAGRSGQPSQPQIRYRVLVHYLTDLGGSAHWVLHRSNCPPLRPGTTALGIGPSCRSLFPFRLIPSPVLTPSGSGLCPCSVLCCTGYLLPDGTRPSQRALLRFPPTHKPSPSISCFSSFPCFPPHTSSSRRAR